LKPTQAEFIRPCLKKTLHKNRAGGMAQGAGPEFKPQYGKKRKQKEKNLSQHAIVNISQINKLIFQLEKQEERTA
jgi:hypothetical protein